MRMSSVVLIAMGWIMQGLACSQPDKPQAVARPLIASAAVESRTAAASVRAAAFANPDSSRYVVRYVTSKPLRTGDSVRVRLQRDTTGGVQGFNQSRMRAFSTDSAAFVVNKIRGKLASYRGCARVIARDKSAGPERCNPFSTNWPAPPDTTPPVIDSIAIDSSQASVLALPLSRLIDSNDWHAKGIYYGGTVLPRSGVPSDLVNGTLRNQQGEALPFKCDQPDSRCPQQQYCAFIVFADGNVAMRAQDAGTCSSLYASAFPAAKRVISPARQAFVNRRTITWSLEPA